jgi:hypothetical protein
MTVTATVLIPSKAAEAAQTTQYVAATGATIIDKFTAVNTGAAAYIISVNLVPADSIANATNIITQTKTLQPNEVYTFPEIVGHVLTLGSSISTIANNTAISIRSSGRIVT